MLSFFLPVLAGAAAAAQGPAPQIAVLEVIDDRPAAQRPVANAVQRAFEDVLVEAKAFQVVPKKQGQNAVCKDDDCRTAFARELKVDRVLWTRIETGHGECLVTATILNVVNKIPEVTAYRPTLCDQSSVLAIVKNQLGPALRRDQSSQAIPSPKPKLAPLSDKRIIGNWTIKHIGSKRGVPPNLSGAVLRFGADGQYRGDGKVYVDSGDAPGNLALAGAYGFDGKILSIRDWGLEFEQCQVLAKKPASFTAAAINETDFSKEATCRLYFETADKIWVWYPGPDEGVILDTWTRAKK